MDFVYYFKAKRTDEDLKLSSSLVSFRKIPEQQSRVNIYRYYESLASQGLKHLFEVSEVALDFVAGNNMTYIDRPGGCTSAHTQWVVLSCETNIICNRGLLTAINAHGRTAATFIPILSP